MNLKCFLKFHDTEVYWNEDKTDFIYACSRCGHRPHLVSRNIEPKPFSELKRKTDNSSSSDVLIGSGEK